MKVNDTKSGILRILKRRGNFSLISNSLNIPEVNCYKYFGVIINQSLLIENQKKLIQTKALALKRRIGILNPSLVELKSRLILYITVIYPKLSYGSNILFEYNSKGHQILSSASYQLLKSLLSIKGNVNKIKLFEILKLNEKFSNHNKQERLSLKVIKLRIYFFFSVSIKRDFEIVDIIWTRWTK